MNAREVALRILVAHEKEQGYINLSLKEGLHNNPLSDVDRGFVTELVYGVVKNRLTIDYWVDSFSKVKRNKMSPHIVQILRLGVYQVYYLDKIPPSAAVNECVKLAKTYGHQASASFVNGLLRNFLRSIDNLPMPSCDKAHTTYLSVKYSHPEWLVKRWLKQFGKVFTEALLEGNMLLPQTTIRVNTLKTTAEQLALKLQEEGFEVTPGKHSDYALMLSHSGNLERTKAFE
ncbi:MAG: 16S rRNA (cytosine(967)-C(5))-methyltransferase RsmB, partial [Hyphomonadaceae bacterium]|nr:16S rRNA (cytosine(967)-C(5))-methyltransferase RsmB [Clostridia bacterium]